VCVCVCVCGVLDGRYVTWAPDAQGEIGIGGMIQMNRSCCVRHSGPCQLL
jgi:hypothetical protein